MANASCGVAMMIPQRKASPCLADSSRNSGRGGGLACASFASSTATTRATALRFIANHICRRFGVSAEVIARRLRIEEFWPPE